MFERRGGDDGAGRAARPAVDDAAPAATTVLELALLGLLLDARAASAPHTGARRAVTVDLVRATPTLLTHRATTGKASSGTCEPAQPAPSTTEADASEASKPSEPPEPSDGPDGPDGTDVLCSDELTGAADLVGLELATALANTDIDTLDAGSAVDAVHLWGKVTAWADAMQGRAAARLEHCLQDLYGLPEPAAPRRTTADPGSRVSATPMASTEVSMRLGITRQAAATMVRTGMLLDGPLAATGEALEEGRITPRKAQIIAGALDGLPLPVVHEVEDAVLPEADRRTPPQLAKDVAEAVSTSDPESATERHAAARRNRRVSHPRALPDGMATMSATLPAQDAVALDAALEAAAVTARQESGETRTTDQLRADILASVGTNALATGWLGTPGVGTPGDGQLQLPWSDGSGEPDGDHSPDHAGPPDGPDTADGDLSAAGCTAAADQPATSDAAEGEQAGRDRASAPPRPGWRLGRVGGVPVHVNVTVPLSTLMGGDESGHLDGYGPIDPATSRAIIATGDATLRRLVTDPLSDTVLDVGRTSYRPPANLAKLIRARDGTCVRPGCNVRATACELDHTIPFSHGGPTAVWNLGALCATDHRQKTLGRFRVTQHPGGIFDWSSPTGHTYRRERGGTITHAGPGTTLPPTPAPSSPAPACGDDMSGGAACGTPGLDPDDPPF
ncbi:HNH endonuclease signature motif containing protein [Georgenia alba]|uniref:DUF222 domain-containing protein n=1 Tax=Georgenia alba TaxID=2233858 RepID=A0ABW2QB76_9MICO